MSTDVFGVERLSPAQTLDHRRLERRACDESAVILTRHGEARVRIINLSAGGVGFTTDPVLALKPGERVRLRHGQMGEVQAVVRWGLHPRYGAEFDPPGSAPNAVCAFYDTLALPS